MFRYTIYILIIFISAVIANFAIAAEIPAVGDDVSSTGFTRIEFCQFDRNLYAFNGEHLFIYNSLSDSFGIVFNSVGYASSGWDPADFTFATDSNNVYLPTGASEKFVYAEISTQTAIEKSALSRNYYSIASRFREPCVLANGVGDIANNTIYIISPDGLGQETEVAQISNKYSGAIAFDYADNLYIADFSSIGDGSGLGNVDIYRISREQLDEFLYDNGFAIVPELIINNAVLAGSDSMVIDSSYNIYIGSYVGIAKITPTSDENFFTVTQVAGDIDANPLQNWPMPTPVFSGITADIISGKLYYSSSEIDENYFYQPYQLNWFNIEPAVNWSSDLNGDGIVDVSDLFLFAQNYLWSGEYLKSDIKQDNVVNMLDFAVFSKDWQKKAPWYKY